MNFKNKRVLIVGLGLFGGGAGAAKFFVKHGAKVRVTDKKDKDHLRESISKLDGMHITYSLGGHNEKDFKWADIVLVNPAVPRDLPELCLAKELETEMNLFFKLCRSSLKIGVTGSNGKSTTTALIGEMLKGTRRKVFTGGNIGVPLLEKVDEINTDDLVVLELSSFQLEYLHFVRSSPQIACVTNITPNHIDRHKTMEAYIDAKSAIVKYQTETDAKVLNYNDKTVRSFSKLAPSMNIFFGKDVYREGEKIIIKSESVDITKRRLLGDFNVENIMAATAVCSEVSARLSWRGWTDYFESVIARFEPLEHRLEFVCKKNGVLFYNDSIATNPESVIKALETLGRDIHLIAGGVNKNLSFKEMAKKISTHVKSLYLIGQSANEIESSVKSQSKHPQIQRCATLDEATKNAFENAAKGQIVLLSPACASFDMFRNFEERGKKFKECVAGL